MDAMIVQHMMQPTPAYNPVPDIPLGPPCTFNALTYSTACSGW